MSNPYADIIHLSRPVSTRYLPMSMHDRAAQFSPFAALTGYDAAIEETARITDHRIILEEDAICTLNRKYQLLIDSISSRPQVSVTYFVPDERKDGGNYVSVSGCIKKIDEHMGFIIFIDGTIIPVNDILEIESDLFQSMM